MSFVTPAPFAYLSNQGASVSYFISASGGTITYDDDYKIHTFTTTGSTDTFTVYTTGSAPFNTVALLVVAGGGAGTGNYTSTCPPSYTASYGGTGSAGGAGGLIYSSSYSLSGTGALTVIVGSGSKSPVNQNKNGQDSTFDSLVAIGGGRGCVDNGNLALTGGSGGGGIAINVNNIVISASFGASGSAGQGYQGANATSSITCPVPGGLTFNRLSGGGGGAGGPASTIYGGPGVTSSISGTPVVYAKGGDTTGVTAGFVLPPNTGNGGMGYIGTVNFAAAALARDGSSGIVIVRYRYQ